MPTVHQKHAPSARWVALTDTFDRRRRGQAPKSFDVGGHGDRFNVFEVLVVGTFTPGKKLLNRPIVGGSCVGVSDRDRKELEELFAGRWAGARDDGWSCEGIW